MQSVNVIYGRWKPFFPVGASSVSIRYSARDEAEIEKHLKQLKPPRECRRVPVFGTRLNR